MMNYHEVAAENPMMKQNKQQYMFLTVLAGAFLGHAMLTSGVLSGVKIRTVDRDDNPIHFPGGEFVYKYRVKDFAASGGTCRRTAEDLGMDYTSDESSYKFYSVFLDDQSDVPSGKERWMAGLLEVSDKSKKAAKEETDEMIVPTVTDKQRRLNLLEKNVVIGQGTCKIGDRECLENYDSIPFESGSLPKARSAYVEFPFGNGIISAMVHSYKIMPKLLAFVKEHGADGNVPVIVTTCSAAEGLCRHYAPLEHGEKFLLGRQTTAQYNKVLTQLKGESRRSMDDIIRDVARGLMRLLRLA